jgi:dTDP-4-amino-4,6-dideoxygalactose transaminase
MQFTDLDRQSQRIRPQIDAGIAAVLAHGRFILGPEVARLEAELAAHAGMAHCVSCANGTDALQLALMALGVGAGHAVFVPAFTFAATAEAVVLAGAVPVFVDVRDDTFNLCPDSLETAIRHVAAGDLVPRAVIPVDLFGQPADYGAIDAIAARNGLAVIADAAQSYGALIGERRAVARARIAATSFFPAKPLGCYGDGGALFTDDADLAAQLRSLRVHGQGTDKYDNVRIGLNSRLDTIQAAVLLAKLAIFDDEIAARQTVAERYTAGLGNVVVTPRVLPGLTSTWAQYTILIDNRDAVAEYCRSVGIPTAVYYPLPLHHQKAYGHCPVVPTGLARSEALARRVLSLPMHPYLAAGEQDRVIDAVRASAVAH